jgi:hypothetical protein
MTKFLTLFCWGKPEWKRQLGRTKHRWEDIVKKDLKEVGCGGLDWMELPHDRDS